MLLRYCLSPRVYFLFLPSFCFGLGASGDHGSFVCAVAISVLWEGSHTRRRLRLVLSLPFSHVAERRLRVGAYPALRSPPFFS
ncbi:hypothetical protein K438DRAFT_1893600 [Mycena galopus ATCC 62051]|nr:hypothetical protein K438DRAFT_1893600 [Mycena galopus ATCC 62051]